MARTTWVVAVLVLTAAIAAGSSSPSAGRSPPASPAAATPSATPARGGELVASFRTEPATYNRYRDASAAGELLSLLTHAPLVHVNRTTDTLEPWLAESWTQSSDGTTYTLKLRPGVTFSDGAPFTSADVLFSFAALYDPQVNAVLAADTCVNGMPLKVEAPDASTVVLRLPAPFAPGLRLIDGIPILPRHKLQAALDAGTFSERVVGRRRRLTEMAGLGPFVLAEHVSGQRLVFARNPHYWRKDAAGTQLPYLDKLTVLIVPDQNTEALRMQAGEIDLMGSGEIRPEDYARLQTPRRAGPAPADRRRRRPRSERAVVQPLPRRRREPAHRLAPRRKRSVRRCPARSIGRPSSTRSTSARRSRSSDRLRRQTGCGIPSRAPTCDHDPARARELLAAAGLTDRNGDGMLEDASGKPVRFSILTHRGHTIRERTVAVLQEQLRQVGIAVDVVALDPPALVQRWTQGDYDSIYFGMQSSATDPALNPQFWLSSGNFHFWNPRQKTPATDWERRIDELMRQQAADLRLPERQRLFAEALRIFGDELPAHLLRGPQGHARGQLARREPAAGPADPAAPLERHARGRRSGPIESRR